MKGILLMAYGSPESLDDIERYLTHIRQGKKPRTEEVEELRNRYIKIGGISPLIEISKRQKDELQKLLTRNGSNTKVYLAMKHSKPFIKDVINEIYNQGIRELLCITLAPHYSILSVGSYIQEVKKAVSELKDIKISFIESWHTNPFFIYAWINRVMQKISLLGNDSWVIFTAHSLPKRILEYGDKYKDQLLETSNLIAIGSDIMKWSFSFQSASQTNEEWLGPDIIDHLDEIYRKGIRKFLIAPIGFVSDNLEILYDIDFECGEWAKQKEVKLVRCDLLNYDQLFIKCLYSLVILNGFA